MNLVKSQCRYFAKYAFLNIGAICLLRDSLQYKLYSLLYRDCCYTVCKIWPSNVRNLLFSLGMNDYWEHQEAINCDNYQCIFNDIKTRIRDQYIQEFFLQISIIMLD